jgi:hypothetical protein
MRGRCKPSVTFAQQVFGLFATQYLDFVWDIGASDAINQMTVLLVHVLGAGYFTSKRSRKMQKRIVWSYLMLEQHFLIKNDYPNEITHCHWQIGAYVSCINKELKALRKDAILWEAIRFARMTAPRPIRTLGQRYIDPQSTQHFFVRDHQLDSDFLHWYEQNPKYVEKLDRLVCTLNDTESPREFRKAWNALADEIGHNPKDLYIAGPTRKYRARGQKLPSLQSELT